MDYEPRDSLIGGSRNQILPQKPFLATVKNRLLKQLSCFNMHGFPYVLPSLPQTASTSGPHKLWHLQDAVPFICGMQIAPFPQSMPSQGTLKDEFVKK